MHQTIWLEHRKYACLVAFALLQLCIAGCNLFDKQPTGDLGSLLKSIETAPESVTLEVFHVRLPDANGELIDGIWQQVDEQQIDATTRSHLVSNGFRAGVLGGALPDELAQALDLQSRMPSSSPVRTITDKTAQPRVIRRVLQLDRQEQATIHASELHEQIELLVSSEGGLHGRTYTQAESVYAMRAELNDGQRIALRLTPEMHHGQLRNRYAGSDEGIFLFTPSREQEVFDTLEIRTELAPGELLIVGCLPNARGSLGHTFHTSVVQGRTEQKLILVRLLQVPPSEILASR